MEQNRIKLAGYDLSWCGQSHPATMLQARTDLLDRTGRYAATMQGSPSPDADAREVADQPLVMTGHQPELFHPGVWYKNFVLSDFARSARATAVNLLIDHDLCRSLSLRVPEHSPQRGLHWDSVPIDSAWPGIPWELRTTSDLSLWKTFPKRVRQSMGVLVGGQKSVLDSVWPWIIEFLERGFPVGQALAAGRHRWEREHGLVHSELPLSRLCGGPAFARFFLQLVSELPRFVEIYNRKRQLYRLHHGIRSAAHPVPALQTDADWHEAPFWIYRPDQPQRRALWVRYRDGRLELSDRLDWNAGLCGSVQRRASLEDFQELAEAGVRVRPRALTTTMFARLFLSDWFIHGIGGGKYDQLTDLILEEWLGIQPPAFAVATATLRLPWADPIRPSVSEANELFTSSIRQQIRQLHHHPERWLSDQAECQPLLRQKAQLLSSIPARGAKKRWHDELRSVNAALFERAVPIQSELERQIPLADLAERQRLVASARDYSLVLFPEKYLSDRLSALASLG
jgi:hypothetical protein